MNFGRAEYRSHPRLSKLEIIGWPSRVDSLRLLVRNNRLVTINRLVVVNINRLVTITYTVL